MEKYLSVEEAAEILGVEYKTVYRLVRSGELPAGRIGRVYRIRESDLSEYFERTKVVNQGAVCAVCGKQVVSVLSIGARCEVCGAPICVRCKETRDAVRCPEHMDESEQKEEKDEK